VTDRRRLLRWGSWFALANASLLALIGIRYLWSYTASASPVSWLYVVIATAGHWAALAYLPFLLVVAPLALLVPRPRAILPLGVLVATVGVTATVLDSLIFAEHRYHLSPLTASLLEPSTWMFSAVYFVLVGVIESVMARGLWRRSAAAIAPRLGWCLAVVLLACFLGSHLVYLWADARYYVPVTSFNHYLPLLHRVRASAYVARLAQRDRVLARGLSEAAAGAAGTSLRYPMAPLSCTAPAPPPNLLLIVIDAMRADSLTAEIAPRLQAFARGTVRFEQHLSGGTGSRPGMFSLFYGLPPTYWDDVAGVLRPPVLMDQLQQAGYQLGLFVASPAAGGVGLERTAFAGVRQPRLRTLAADGWARDRALTSEWYAWLDRRDPARPFFGFLYYDSAQVQKAPEAGRRLFPRPPGASRQEGKRANYLAAVHYVDGLVGEAIADLEQRGLLERTIVVVTSDHGSEFDERGLGFAGHGTAYSSWQLHTPFLVRIPGHPPSRVTRRTSHYDVAPTILRRVLGCGNPPSDYGVGRDLFSDGQWDWIIAASYEDFALVEPDRVTVIGRTGYYEIRDSEYRLIPRPRVRADVVGAAMREMTRFYR